MAKQLFEDVFNKSALYEMLFFNVKAVLVYPTLKELAENNESLYERWNYLSKTKYENIPAGQMVDMATYAQKKYEQYAVQHPEYCRIVAITCATLYAEQGKLKRFFQKFVNEDERMVIDSFMDVLNQLSSEGVKSSPQYFPTLCGHNIIGYDIPLLIKRFILHRDVLEIKELPLILKRALNIKPWESGLMDTVNVWKFNGFEYTPLMLIGDYLGLKKTVDLLPHEELSKYYWENVGEKPSETLEYVALQSATQTNMVIQLINTLRQL